MSALGRHGLGLIRLDNMRSRGAGAVGRRVASPTQRRDEEQIMASQNCMVCSKAFETDNGMKWNHDGKWYMFDDMGCRNRFISNPAKYLESAAAT